MSIDKKALEEFNQYWSDLFRIVPAARTAAVIVWSEVVQKEVQSQIKKQGVDDLFYHVQSWQEKRIGSKGGYAVVSPRKSFAGADRYGRIHKYNGNDVTAKQVTSWLESGHGNRKSFNNVRFNSATAKRYTKGYRFYSWAEFEAERAALKAADDAVIKIADEIGY